MGELPLRSMLKGATLRKDGLNQSMKLCVLWEKSGKLKGSLLYTQSRYIPPSTKVGEFAQLCEDLAALL